MSTLHRLLRQAALVALPVAAACASAAGAAVPAVAATGPAALPAVTQPAATQPDDGASSQKQLCAAAGLSQLLGIGALGPMGPLGPWGPMGPDHDKARPDCGGNGLLGLGSVSLFN
jgi:hypothetical protein